MWLGTTYGEHHLEIMFFLISDKTCNAPVIGERIISGSEWSDESCALIHGAPTGVRIWHTPADNYIKLFTSWVAQNKVEPLDTHLGLYSLSRRTSYRKISWSLTARLGFSFFQSIWNFTGTTAAEVPVKFQIDTNITTSTVATSRLHQIWR